MRPGSTEEVKPSKRLLASTSKTFLLLYKSSYSSPRWSSNLQQVSWKGQQRCGQWILVAILLPSDHTQPQRHTWRGGAKEEESFWSFRKKKFCSVRIHPGTFWNLIHTFICLKQNIHTEQRPWEVLERKAYISFFSGCLLWFLYSRGTYILNYSPGPNNLWAE